MSDDELKKLINKHRGSFTKRITRCFYEDEWEETVANEEAIFKFIKEVVLNKENNEQSS